MPGTSVKGKQGFQPKTANPHDQTEDVDARDYHDQRRPIEPQPGISQDALAKLIVDLTAKVDALQTQVQKQQTQIPTMKPMEVDDPHGSNKRRQIFEELQGGTQEKGDFKQLSMDSHGQRLPDLITPKFPQGTTVQIRRDITREGQMQTWGAILDKVQSPGVGLVIRPFWLSKIGQWKYQVRVPGLTKPTGDGFHDYELEAA